jgi:hypothetical protein
MTAGLAAAFVSPAFGQQASLQGPGQPHKQDPTTQYTAPPSLHRNKSRPALQAR